MMSKIPVLLVGGAVFLLGCAMNATAQQLRTRAGFDLGCAENELEIVPLDPRTRGVKGCGQQATYVEQCKPCANGYVGCECTWLLNTDGRRDRGFGLRGGTRSTTGNSSGTAVP